MFRSIRFPWISVFIFVLTSSKQRSTRGRKQLHVAIHWATSHCYMRFSLRLLGWFSGGFNPSFIWSSPHSLVCGSKSFFYPIPDQLINSSKIDTNHSTIYTTSWGLGSQVSGVCFWQDVSSHSLREAYLSVKLAPRRLHEVRVASRSLAKPPTKSWYIWCIGQIQPNKTLEWRRCIFLVVKYIINYRIL